MTNDGAQKQDEKQTEASHPAPGRSLLDPSDTFVRRHIGPDEAEVAAMLESLGYASLDALADATIPASIRSKSFSLTPLPGQPQRPLGEFELLDHLRAMADENQVFRSCIGMGYSDVIVPGVIQRNILENPGWYTQYTPYQAEISQGRLEALLNFQTAVADLTGLPLANASLLDEATAAAEAMDMCNAIAHGRKRGFFVAEDCHPQTIAVVRTRGESIGMHVQVGSQDAVDFANGELCGVLLQYPTTDGRLVDPRPVIEAAHAAGAAVVMAADLLALTLIAAPGELGADIAVGSTQRFGVPMGYGGPHAAYLSTRNEHARKLPGRLVGVSRDVHGHLAYRLAIQTREQHIRRDKATSNICTAQVLLAILASMYAVYHGPDGLRAIARRIHALTAASPPGSAGWGTTRATPPSSTRCACGRGESRPTPSMRRPRIAASISGATATTASGSHSTRRARPTTSWTCSSASAGTTASASRSTSWPGRPCRTLRSPSPARATSSCTRSSTRITRRP